MTRFLRRSMTLLLALLLSVSLFLSPSAALAQNPYTIQEMGDALREVQAELTQAQTDAQEAEALWLSLEETLAEIENTASKSRLASLQDDIIDAMIAYEDATAEASTLTGELADLWDAHEAMLPRKAKPQTLKAKGYDSQLTIAVIVDEDGVIWDVDVTVKGDKRDKAVSEPAFLVQFIGRRLPLTTDEKDEAHITLLSSARVTSQAVVDALNTLAPKDTGKSGKSDKTSGPIIEPQDIADYLFEHGELPENFITKKEAQAMGWDSSYNYVSDVAPGYSIGGDRFGNYEGQLPSKKGRTWYEADCYYTKGKRNAHRIVFSNDGLVYYTNDHYESFTQMKPSWE